MTAAETIHAELTALCPDFAAAWNAEGELWMSDDGVYTVHGVFAVFSHYIAELLVAGTAPELPRVFEYVESKLTDDDSEVDNAVCTCFLESLVNRMPETIPPQHIVPLLGPKSVRFCRAYGWTWLKPLKPRQ